MGGAMTAGLAAHAIDPAHGTRRGHAAWCPNCGARLGGRFCHDCGQAGHVHRTVGHVVEELVHGILHVDSKGWRTLPMLVFNPGRLTREYVNGRRARYIAPLGVFLFAFFLMFLVFSLGGSTFEIGNGGWVEAERDQLREAETELARVRADAGATADERGRAAAAVASARADLATAQAAPPVGSSDLAEGMRKAADSGEIRIKASPRLESKIRSALRNPDFTLYKIQQKAYKLSFLLIPLSLPVLWFIFILRPGVTLYDHAVFVLYSLSFMSFLVSALVLLRFLGPPVENYLATIIFLVPPLHMFAQLKGAYRLGWRGALWRTVVLSIAGLIVLACYFGLMLLLGLID